MSQHPHSSAVVMKNCPKAVQYHSRGIELFVQYLKDIQVEGQRLTVVYQILWRNWKLLSFLQIYYQRMLLADRYLRMLKEGKTKDEEEKNDEMIMMKAHPELKKKCFKNHSGKDYLVIIIALK